MTYLQLGDDEVMHFETEDMGTVYVIARGGGIVFQAMGFEFRPPNPLWFSLVDIYEEIIKENESNAD